MKLLIGTPAYGGMLTINYAISMIESTRNFIRDKVDFHVYALGNESLINRGRNTIANFAMQGDYDKLLFIDSDIGWTYDDLCFVLNSNKPIIGGTYPMKAFPMSLNFNPMPGQFEVFEHTEADGTKTYRKTIDKYDLYCQQFADKTSGEVEVLHVPTGFMAINVKQVFGALKDKVATYDSHDFRTGKLQVMHDFFPVRVKDRVLESEDWAFCSIAREAGIPVFLQTKVVLSHVGNYTFDIRRGMV
jgi:hypothetical protein